MCTAISYRSPVYLAKVAATADVISGGRIQMGIGGGWYEHEWRAYGYGFPSTKVRLGRLGEGVQIMRDAWRDGKVSFTGEHYQVDGAVVAPKPVKDQLQQIRDRMVGYVPEAAADSMIAGTSGPESAASTTEQVVERLQQLRDLDCRYAIRYFPEAAYDRIELFEREVIPARSDTGIELGRM
ncbi:MAG: LLM class flavin-dependent oxidoreductase [Pseudonocardiaceae bacterium]